MQRKKRWCNPPVTPTGETVRAALEPAIEGELTGGSVKRSLAMARCVAGILPAIRRRDALDTTIAKAFRP